MSKDKALNLLHKQLDKREANRFSRPSERIHDTYRSTQEREEFEYVLKRAEKQGIITIDYGKAELSHIIIRIQVKNFEKLYIFLNRNPAINDSTSKIDSLKNQISKEFIITDSLNYIFNEIKERWEVNKEAFGTKRNNYEQVIPILRCIAAIDQFNDGSSDMRTFSTRYLNDSKLIEKNLTKLGTYYKKNYLYQLKLTLKKYYPSLG